MAWVQVKQFNLSKMGKASGYCLKNVRIAFGIEAKYASAKDAMLANKKEGTLHSISTLPKNVAVPVFVDTSSPYEHVEVSDKGVFYSDGKKVSNPNKQKFFGWGETLNGVRVVKWVEDKKSNEQIADEVIAGKWGNGAERKKRLTAAGYNYDTIQAIVNEKVKGGNSSSNSGTITTGSRVLPISWKDYNGKTLVKTRDYYFVKQISGDRAVLTADSLNGPVYAAVKLSDLRKV